MHAQKKLLHDTNNAMQLWKNDRLCKKQNQIIEKAQGVSSIDRYIEIIRPLFDDLSWVSIMVSRLCNIQHENIFTNIELRSSKESHAQSLLLHQDHKISLHLTILKAHPSEKYISDNFLFGPDTIITAIVKANGASYQKATLDTDNKLKCSTNMPCYDNQYHIFDNRTECLNINMLCKDVIILRAVIKNNGFEISTTNDDNRSLHYRNFSTKADISPSLSTADETTARAQFMFSILREAGRIDCSALFVEWLLSDDHNLRWYIMKEFLALDAIKALPHLDHMAKCDDNQNVRKTALQSLHFLNKQYPQLFIEHSEDIDICP